MKFSDWGKHLREKARDERLKKTLSNVGGPNVVYMNVIRPSGILKTAVAEIAEEGISICATRLLTIQEVKQFIQHLNLAIALKEGIEGTPINVRR